jgi:hypothetical protein
MPYYLPTISALDMASGAVAIAVAYAAYRYRRFAGGSVPWFLGVSFSLLGLGLLLEGSLALALYAHPLVAYAELFRISSYLYLTLQLIAYLILAVGYTEVVYSAGSPPVPQLGLAEAYAAYLVPWELRGALVVKELRGALVVNTAFFDAIQLASIVFLALVVMDALQLRSSGSFSGMVLSAFVLMLAGHAVMLAYPMGFFAYYLAGNAVRFAGFALLLAFLLRGRHIV